MRPEPPPAAAWFGALLGPVRGPVAAAWRRLPGAPECVPRAGLGGAVVAQVARGWGTRRWQEAGRVAITAIEALNQLVHRGLPLEAERGAWLTADLRLAIGVARRVGRSDEALLRRVACRFVDAPGFGSVPSPEAVLFLRGAVAAGVIAGAVPDAIHAALDAWACALGSAIEATEQGEEKERSSFLALAVSALEGVPDADARDRMLAVLSPGPSHSGALRVISGWAPMPIPEAAPGFQSEGTLLAFDSPLVGAMDAMLPGEGPLRAAGSWLLVGGGKRLRARIAQASARAVGADPELATAAAAAVEWIHTASLVLDDIVDGADLRRGAPALHRASSPAFAAGVASWVLVRVLLAPTGVHDALADAMIGLAEGQRAELARAGDLDLTLADWYAIAAAKTARLFRCAASCGGRLGCERPPLVSGRPSVGSHLRSKRLVIGDSRDSTEIGSPAPC